jgi:DNA invertase Pin-like site-specific DNA recombinase
VDVQKDDIPMQKIACHEFAQCQGWTISGEYAEKGVSGFKISANNRDAIQDLKKAALNGEFDILLVYMFDRIGRIDDETPFVVEWFTKHGIAVWSVNEGEQRFDSHVDKLMNYIRFWQASGESAKTSMRIKTRMRQLICEGCYTGGVTPFGYRLIKKGRLNKKGAECFDLTINEDEAKYVVSVFEKTVRDGYGSHRLAEWLNRQGIRTHNDAKFQCNTVIRILRNRLYTGHYSTAELISPKIEELTIISDELFRQAQAILDQRSAKNEEKREISRSTVGRTLLSGNVYCKDCGGRIVSTSYTDRYTKKDGEVSEKKMHRYICYHKSRKLNDCTGQSAYIAEKIDASVISTLQGMFKAIKEQPESVSVERKIQAKTQNLKSAKKKIENELEKNTRQLEKLQLEIADSLTGDSVYTAEDLSRAIKTVKDRISVNEKNLAETEAQLNQQNASIGNISLMYNNFLSWANEFDGLPLEQKKMIAGNLIKRVELEKGYKVHIVFNMDYEQFCYEWDKGKQ